MTDIKSIIGKKIAIHCKTQEECGGILDLMQAAGLKWCSGLDANHPNAGKYYGTDKLLSACYGENNHIEHGTFADYNEDEENFTILPASDFLAQSVDVDVMGLLESIINNLGNIYTQDPASLACIERIEETVHKIKQHLKTTIK